MKPVILLSTGSNQQNYIDAVEAAGGIADAKYAPEVCPDYDGLILCGGSDIHPNYYGEEINGSVNIDDVRDRAEFALAKAFIDAGKPVMGICRGCQLLNVYFGGTLYQHIECAELHKSSGGVDAVHITSATSQSILGKLYGESFATNSRHHQAIKKAGAGLEIMQYAGDIVEGFQHRELPVFAVQWHPERICAKKRREDTVDGIKIFEYFIEMCKKNNK